MDNLQPDHHPDDNGQPSSGRAPESAVPAADGADPQRRVRQEDIAAATGFSLSTVSQALNPDGRPVAARTRRLIREAAERLGYEPNNAARSLARGHDTQIGIYMPSFSEAAANPYFFDLLLGISEGAEQYGLRLIPNDIDDEGRLYARLSQVMGVLIVDPEPADRNISRVLSRGLPALSVGRCTNVDSPPPLVDIDVAGAVRLIFEHIEAQGFSRPALLLHEGVTSYVQDLEAAFYYEAGLRGWAGQVGVRVARHPLEGETRTQVIDLLSKPDQPDLFIGATDSQAAAVVSAVRDLQGLSIPQDIGVIGIGGTLISHLVEPPLTTVQTRPRWIGRQAARLLIQQATRGTAAPADVILPVTLRMDASTLRHGTPGVLSVTGQVLP